MTDPIVYERFSDGVERITIFLEGDYNYVLMNVRDVRDYNNSWLTLSNYMHKEVYLKRGDDKYGDFTEWLGRLRHMIIGGDCYVIYKYRTGSDKLVGAAIINPANVVHYGNVLNVYAMFNKSGSVRGFYNVFKHVADKLEIDILSRSTYMGGMRYMTIYKEI